MTAAALLANIVAAGSLAQNAERPNDVIRVNADVAGQGKAISPDLIGIFFEDLNYAADGGLYAELVQNRSFEYTAADNKQFHALFSWELEVSNDVKATVNIDDTEPLNASNKHYAVINVDTSAAAKAIRLINTGFGGIAVAGGDKYDLSLFSRRVAGDLEVATARLESKSGEVVAEAAIPAAGDKWMQQKATLEAKKDAADARLVIEFKGAGRLALDVVSLFPQKTFRNRSNGLRADLGQTIADLKPKFMRFPGGCLVHGRSLDSIYNWKETVGPIEQRKAKPNMWGYHQTVGLGYFEYFQFCEDIGAAPIPVVAAGVTCQFQPTKHIPMADMPAYIQDLLDLVEWANGPVTSTWGAKRAAAGHPEPFNLKYLAIGNEDAITPEFRERFTMMHSAIKAKHPEIVIIGTSGPFSDGPDFDRGWEVADQIGLDMIDEHYYKPPGWFLSNADYYDKHKRGKTTVYLGEYAAHDVGRRATLRSALAEAAYLTNVERNADVVRFASYAPLLGKIGNTQWDPNLIYFSNQKVAPTINYEVQKLFGTNSGDRYLATTVEQEQQPIRFGSTFFIGTWDTQAEFDDVRVSRGDQRLFTEDFSTAANDWVARDGRWSVAGGTYRQAAGGQPALSHITKPVAKGDYTYSLRARKTGGAEGFLIGFNVVDDDNFYWWNLGGWGNSRHVVEKCTDGSKQELGQQIQGRIEANRWYDIRIEVKDQKIRCFLDGKLMHEYDNTGFKPRQPISASTLVDSKTGDVIVKLVNVGSAVQPVVLRFGDNVKLSPEATKTVLTGDPMAVNTIDVAPRVKPVISPMRINATTKLEAPAHSLTIIRVKAVP